MEDPSFGDIVRSYDPVRNRSVRVLTPYERAAVLACRAQQLAMGAPTTLAADVADALSDVRQIARRELELGRMPLMVCRRMPDGTFEYWRLSDMVH